MVDVILVSGDSNQASNCVSSSGVCHNTSPSTIRNWLVSLSKVTAVYALLVVRIGTKCDGKRLRKKVKSTRQKAVSLMQLVQASLLPHINQESFQTKASSPISTEYMNLFMFHCVCIEYFIEQLLRTLDLIVSFRLSFESHSKWPVMYRNPLIYSGFTLWNRKKQKCEFAKSSTKAKLHALSDHKLINRLKSNYVTSSMSENSQTSSENEEKANDKPESKLRKTPSESHCSHSKNSTDYRHKQLSSYYAPKLPKNTMSPDQEYDDLNNLQKDIQVIKNLILEVYSKVKINPWAVKPMRKKKSSTRSSKDPPSTYNKVNDLSLGSSRKLADMWEEDEDDEEEDDFAFSDEESDIIFPANTGKFPKKSINQSNSIYSKIVSNSPSVDPKQQQCLTNDENHQWRSFSKTSFKNASKSSSSGRVCGKNQEGKQKLKTKHNLSLTQNQIGYISILNYRRQRVVRRRYICICIVSSFSIVLLVLAITFWLFIYAKKNISTSQIANPDS